MAFFVSREYRKWINQQLKEIKRQFSSRSGSALDPEPTYQILQKLIEGKFNKGGLKLLSQNESLIIPAVNGSETIYRAKKLFPAGIDSRFQYYYDASFKEYDIGRAKYPAEERAVEVYEIQNQFMSFSQVFNAFGADLNKLCLNQNQIKKFVKKYPDWLCGNGDETIFLFKVRDLFFIACVRDNISSIGLGINLWPLEECPFDIFFARHVKRVVIPRLAT